MTPMKQLKDLNATYANNDIGALVEFVEDAPVRLPEGGRYHYQKAGSVVHVYGIGAGIEQYDVVPAAGLSHVQSTTQGIELVLNGKEVNRVILHSEPMHAAPVAPAAPRRQQRRAQSDRTASSESRPGESKPSYRRAYRRPASESSGDGES